MEEQVRLLDLLQWRPEDSNELCRELLDKPAMSVRGTSLPEGRGHGG